MDVRVCLNSRYVSYATVIKHRLVCWRVRGSCFHAGGDCRALASLSKLALEIIFNGRRSIDQLKWKRNADAIDEATGIFYAVQHHLIAFDLKAVEFIAEAAISGVQCSLKRLSLRAANARPR